MRLITQSTNLWYFIASGGKIRGRLQTFSSSKAKIYVWLERTFGEQDLLINTRRILKEPPLNKKVNELQQQFTRSRFFYVFSRHLEKFYEY